MYRGGGPTGIGLNRNDVFKRVSIVNDAQDNSFYFQFLVDLV